MKENQVQQEKKEFQEREILNDYTTTRVADDQRRGWLSMALMWAGTGVSLGLIVTGGSLGDGLSFQQAIIAAFIGGIALAVVTTLCGIVGGNTGLSTAMVSKFTFGRKAVAIIALIQAFGSFGWFGVQLGLFGKTAATAFNMSLGFSPPVFLCIILGGILMVLTSFFGYKSLELLSKIVVPLLIILLLLSVYKIVQFTPLQEIWNLQPAGEQMTLGYGISVAISSFIVGAVVAPDVSRYAKSPKDTAGAAFLAFAVVVPVMMVIGILMAQVAGTKDLVDIMLKIGWRTMALIVLLLTQWSSNDNNLYCSILGFAVVFKKLKPYQLTLIGGAIGIMLALSGIYENFLTFLNFLGVLIPPMGGVIVADYFIFNRKYYNEKYLDKLLGINWRAFAAWIIGSAVSFITTYTAVSITTISAVDGLLTAFAVYFLICRFSKESGILETK